jgi:predicted RNase H-like nuclease (RuvC/YqgF family)
MSEKSEGLANTLLKQDEILSELLVVVVKQREALKEGRLSDLQDLMSDLRRVSVRCQAIETKRARVSGDVARELGCEAIVSQIIGVLPPEESAVVEESAKKLTETVNKLKIEMSILSRLMNEARTLNEMLITEWRRLSEKYISPGALGTFDTMI